MPSTSSFRHWGCRSSFLLVSPFTDGEDDGRGRYWRRHRKQQQRQRRDGGAGAGCDRSLATKLYERNGDYDDRVGSNNTSRRRRIEVAALLSDTFSRAKRTLSYKAGGATTTTTTTGGSSNDDDDVDSSSSIDRSRPRRVEDAVVVDADAVDARRRATDSPLSNATGRAEEKISSFTTESIAQEEESASGNDIDIDIDIGTTTNSANQDDLEDEARVTQNYGRNPAVTSTALAHSMWSHVLSQFLRRSPPPPPPRGSSDDSTTTTTTTYTVTAIDATAGNGEDAVVIAKMLFGDTDNTNTVANKASAQKPTTSSSSPQFPSSSRLICVDVSEQACNNTRNKLRSVLSDDVMERNIEILHRSHNPLPVPRRDVDATTTSSSSVALVVYNLGYLPNLKHATSATDTESTVCSMADAALALRVGGLLSVMTYPRSNREEDAVVRAFLQGLALFSSVTTDYETFLRQHEKFSPDDDDRSEHLRDLLRKTLGRVLSTGGAIQTWRVYEHRKIGWTDAPILVTATRIK